MATIETYAMPTLLYRYRALRPRGTDGDGSANRVRLERELSAIEQGYIWCGTFDQMIDPMEGFYRSNARQRARFDYDQFTETVRNGKLGLGIASLSETWNNELMWAHMPTAFAASASPIRWRGCSTDSTMITPWRTLPMATGHTISTSAPCMIPMWARAILSTKNLKWSYEREWRLFSPRPGRARHRNGAAATVFLGMRMDEDDRELITQRMRAAGVRGRQTLADGYSVKRARREPDDEA